MAKTIFCLTMSVLLLGFDKRQLTALPNEKKRGPNALLPPWKRQPFSLTEYIKANSTHVYTNALKIL